MNKFPDYVGYLVRWLKSMCPAMGKLRMAQALARAGLLLVTWYNEYRPHQALDGATPNDVKRGKASPEPGIRFEPRPRWPVNTGRDGQCQRASRLHLIVAFVEGRRHLHLRR